MTRSSQSQGPNPEARRIVAHCPYRHYYLAKNYFLSITRMENGEHVALGLLE